MKRLVCCIAAASALLLVPAAAAAAATTRSRIVSLAARQINYREPGNFCTKYGPCELWCSLFVTWVWRHSGVPVPSLAFTGYMYDWAKRETHVLGPAGTPQPGDATLIGSGPSTVATSLHTGIVQAVYPGYLVTIEGDVLHDVVRFVVPTAHPQRAGEPGPIYAYASPVRGSGPPAARTAAAPRFPSLSPAMIGRQASMSSTKASPLLRTITALRAFQHMPYRMPHARINWTGISAQGLVEVKVTTAGSLQTAQTAWSRFLHRFHDAGHAYQVTFQAAGAGSVPVAGAPPTISGLPFAGQTLTEAHGMWLYSPTAYTYQWEDCDGTGQSCTPIYGATGQTYTLTTGDVGHAVRVVEIASNAAGAGQSATSDPTGAVQGFPVGI